MTTEIYSILNELENITNLDRIKCIEFLREHDGQDDYSHNDDWRVIHQDSIDAIQSEELGNDDYLLGCFNASFLASVLDIDVDVIQSMQEAEAYEAIGKLINSMDKIEELQTRYSTMDGYGHHFAHYDHETHEIGDYYLFRTN